MVYIQAASLWRFMIFILEDGRVAILAGWASAVAS